MKNLAKNWVFQVCTKGLVKSCFYHWKCVFSGNKTSTNLKPRFSAKVYIKCLAFSSFFQLFAPKTLKKHILTSVWSVQHPNAGENIQHIITFPKHKNHTSKKCFDYVISLPIVLCVVYFHQQTVLHILFGVKNIFFQCFNFFVCFSYPTCLPWRPRA